MAGLTSAGNVAFTRSLGCYDEVLAYDRLTTLPADVPTAYVDFAGSDTLRARVHEHFGARLVHDAIVGVTHQETGPQSDQLPGPPPTFFFAPDQIRGRAPDWGPGGVEQRFGAAWRRFVPAVEGWVDVVHGSGADALQQVWGEVLSGRGDPRTGHVLQL